MRIEQLEHLLQVLADRDIDLGRDDVAWAFESAKTTGDACAWVDEYLHAPTLLSPDEFQIYNTLPEKLQRQHLHSQSTAHQEDSRAFSDEDVQDALERLESSTASIEAQIKHLEIQKEALRQLKAQNETTDASVTRAREAHFKKQEKEKRQLDFSVEELSDELRTRIVVAEKDASGALNGLSPFVNDTFGADDHLLSGFTKLLPRFQQTFDNRVALQQTDHWCRAVVSFQAAKVKARIDALCPHVYSVQNGHPMDRKWLELEEERSALGGELETLKEEIIPVLSMVVDHEFRRPIKEASHGRQGEFVKSQGDWLSYIYDSLNYMRCRLDAIESHAQGAHAYNQALKEFQTFLSQELSEMIPEKTGAQEKKRKSRDLRALVNPQTGLREFLLGRGAPQKEDPADRLLRHLDIQPKGDRAEHARNACESAVNDRQKRLQEHCETTDRSMLKSLAESLDLADTDLQNLLSSVYGYTEFNNARLSDRTSEERIHNLEGAIDKAVKKLGGFDEDDTEGLEQKKDILIKKWS
ncbi:hypothetical protein EV356DRAFT_512281 [Viridothelium virens]|uniref:HAUS augmin-like complex subunit 3 N-terminal domain-containing protein n=1 Tax=Viridothelium virens TaxID=1048519 RepID=A0A6A6HG42_VIRVR|nr:hypothetical protein EV356DRAFT_512281 [Viridothelium virens]